MPKLCTHCRESFEDSYSYCPHCRRQLLTFNAGQRQNVNNYCVSDWLQYLEHLSSSSQNFLMGFATIVIASLTIVLTIIIANNENTNYDLLTKAVVGVFVVVVALYFWWTFLRGSYGPNALIGKSAKKLLDDYFSGNHPELNTSQGIQCKWNEIQTKIERIRDNTRQCKRQRKNLINNNCSFQEWYYNQ